MCGTFDHPPGRNLETRNSFQWRVEICGTKAARIHPLSKPKPDLVRRYAFQHPQRAGDIARLLPSSFILRNPRDCKDFQRQAGWKMWKSPAFPAYEHSWYVATQICWVEMFTPKIGGEDFLLRLKNVENISLSRSDDLVMFDCCRVMSFFCESLVRGGSLGPFRNTHALEVDRYPSRQMYRGVIHKEKGELELNPKFGEACQATLSPIQAIPTLVHVSFLWQQTQMISPDLTSQTMSLRWVVF